MLKGWAEVFGSSWLSLRMTSALAMAGAAAGVVVLGRLLANDRTALVAGMVFALLPVVSEQGAEARSPALTTALATWSTVALIRAIDVRGGSAFRRWVVYSALLLVTTYVFLFAALIVAAHATSLAWHRGPPGTWKRFVTASGVAAMASVPVAYAGFSQRDHVSWLARTSAEMLGTLPYAWISPSSGGLGRSVLAILVWSVILLGLVGVYAPGSRPRARRVLVRVAMPWLLVPPGLLVALSSVQGAFTPRYVVFCAPALALLLAQGFVTIRPRAFPAAIGVAGLLLALPLQQAHVRPEGRDFWGPKRDVLTDKAMGGDGVLASPDFYARLVEEDRPVAGLVTLNRGPDAIDVNLLGRLARVWVVPRFPTEQGRYDRELVGLGFVQSKALRAGNVELVLYERR